MTTTQEEFGGTAAVPPLRKLSTQQQKFVDLVGAGFSLSEAYRRAYRKPKGIAPILASNGAYKIAKNPAVRAALEAQRGQARKLAKLSLEQRLGILTDIATGKNRPNERTRAIEVYTKIAGDGAPERVETSGPAGGPIQTETTATETVTVIDLTDLPRRERLDALKVAREAKG